MDPQISAIVLLIGLVALFSIILKRTETYGDKRDMIRLACKILHVKPRDLFIDAYKHSQMYSHCSNEALATLAWEHYRIYLGVKKTQYLSGYKAPLWIQIYIRDMKIFAEDNPSS